MKLLSKRMIIWLVLFLGITAGVVKAKNPQLWQRTTQSLTTLPVVKEVKQEGSKQLETAEQILGGRIEKVNTQVQQDNLPVGSYVDKIVGDSQLTREIQTQIETKVIEKTQEIQQLPQEAVEEIKKEVRKEIRRQMCEEWLKEE